MHIDKYNYFDITGTSEIFQNDEAMAVLSVSSNSSRDLLVRGNSGFVAFP